MIFAKTPTYWTITFRNDQFYLLEFQFLQTTKQTIPNVLIFFFANWTLPQIYSTIF